MPFPARPRRILALFVATWVLLLARNAAVFADIRTTGDVTPVPPIGGTLAGDPPFGPFEVGITSTGNVNFGQGTSLTSTGKTVLGVEETGIGTVVMNGLGTAWTTNDLTIGELGAGFVSLTGQSKMTVQRFTTIGSKAGSQATVTITGLGTVWDSQNTTLIGDNGYGQVNVTDGGTFLSKNTVNLGNNETGEARVVVQGNLATGTLSRWTNKGIVNVGNEGLGYLFIRSFGRVTNTATGNSIGSQEGARGFVEVTGAGSLWDTQSLDVGKRGFGSLRILDGGRVTTAKKAQFGVNSTGRGQVEISGLGSIWTVDSLTTLTGEANITVSNDGLLLTKNRATIGRLGRVALNGGRIEAAAIVSTGLIEGGGTIKVPVLENQARGRIHTSENDHLIVRGKITNNGVIDLAGGELEVLDAVTNNSDIDLRNATIRFGGTGLLNELGSQLAITDGVVDIFGRVNNLGEIVVGRLADAIFHDNVTTTNLDVKVKPGGSVLMLENLTFLPTPLPASIPAPLSPPIPTSASLSLLLDSVYDTAPVQVLGSASLAGTLSVATDAGFMPKLGDSFDILSAAGGLTGSFDSLVLPGLGQGLGWDVDYQASKLALSVVSGSVLADINGDGSVDSADIGILLDYWGMSKGPADLTHDGFVDGSDIGIVFSHWTGDSVGSVAVPEPTSLVPILAMVCVAVRRRNSAA